jgi:hypothetical protein
MRWKITDWTDARTTESTDSNDTLHWPLLLAIFRFWVICSSKKKLKVFGARRKKREKQLNQTVFKTSTGSLRSKTEK